MKTYPKILLYGFLLWLIVFIVSFLIYPLRESNRAFFETIMSVSIALFTVLFSTLLNKKLDKELIKYGLISGIIWLVINIVIDLLLFSWGPMKMGFIEYMQDIGFTYLIIPIITFGIGYQLDKRK